MARRKPNKTKKTNTKRRVRRERETLPWKFALLTIFCILFLVVGFFGAARQHFASINYGIKNSKLRKQIDELKQQKRRLLIAREIATTPYEINKAAQKIGFQEHSPDNTEIVKVNQKTAENPQITKIVNSKPLKTLLIKKNEPFKKIIKPESKTDALKEKMSKTSSDKTEKTKSAVKTFVK